MCTRVALDLNICIPRLLCEKNKEKREPGTHGLCSYNKVGMVTCELSLLTDFSFPANEPHCEVICPLCATHSDGFKVRSNMSFSPLTHESLEVRPSSGGPETSLLVLFSLNCGNLATVYRQTSGKLYNWRIPHSPVVDYTSCTHVQLIESSWYVHSFKAADVAIPPLVIPSRRYCFQEEGETIWMWEAGECTSMRAM